jgi:ABC-type uncharacterized transport system permease subunit
MTDSLIFCMTILAAGLRTGTPLLFATLGAILNEKSGVLNLGMEGMMLVGALAGFATTHQTGNPWLGVTAGIAAGGALSLLHAFVAITLRGDQVVSGLALAFVGRGLTAVLGAQYVQVRDITRLPTISLPFLKNIPLFGNSILYPLFGEQNIVFYLGVLAVPLISLLLTRTRWGLHLRAVGDDPTAADSVGISVRRQRYLWVFVGGCFAGLAGATLSLAVTPLWIEDLTAGQGWIAIGLVIFAGWLPWRAALGAYMFGALRRLPLDLQAVAWLPFAKNPNLGILLDMLPYAFTIFALLFSSLQAQRQRQGAPLALGVPYRRGERGL